MSDLDIIDADLRRLQGEASRLSRRIQNLVELRKSIVRRLQEEQRDQDS